jgi:hypothetical protein
MSRNNINESQGSVPVQDFINLQDVPPSYVGQAGLYCQVNPSQTGLQFAPASGPQGPPGATTFIGLTDGPGTYPLPGQFLTGAPGSVSWGTPALTIEKATDYNQFGYDPPGGVLTSTGLGFVLQLPTPVNDNELNVLDTVGTSFTVPSAFTESYRLDLNYYTLNNGFTLTLPNYFQPTYASNYTIEWAYTFQRNVSTSHSSGVQTITIELVGQTSGVIATLNTTSYNINTTPISPNFQTETLNGRFLSIPLNVGFENYYIVITFFTTFTGTYILGDKLFNIFTGSPTLIIDNTDYLSSGYGTNGQVLTTNGVDGFTVKNVFPAGTGILYNTSGSASTIANGSEQNVLQINGGVPAWAPISAAEIPDPLPVNSIIERTSGSGVNINNNAALAVQEGGSYSDNGLVMFYNKLNISDPINVLASYFIGSISFDLFDSVSNAIMFPNFRFTVMKIGGLINLQITNPDYKLISSNPLNSPQSFLYSGVPVLPFGARPSTLTRVLATVGVNSVYEPKYVFEVDPPGNFSIRSAEQIPPYYSGFNGTGYRALLINQSIWYNGSNGGEE